jgi:lysophospholipase L1-like esterase
VIEELAKEFGCIHLPFNHMFNQLLKDMPTSKDNYWIWDGIHPTPAGHKRMADMWIQQCEKIFNVIKK